MPTTHREAEPTTESYQDFLASLEVHLIALTSSSFKISRDEFFGNDESSVSFKLASKPIDVQASNFDVQSTLTLDVTGDKTGKKLIHLTATYLLHFHVAHANEVFVKRLCGSEIRLIAWPYFREYVSDITGRMFIPPLLLPLSEQPKKR